MCPNQPMDDRSLAHLDAVAQAALVRRDELTPSELVEAAIRRIERLDPELHSVIHPAFDDARREVDRVPGVVRRARAEAARSEELVQR